MSLPLAASLSDNLEKAFDEIVTFLPKLVAFLLILIIGYIVARIVKGIVTKLLQKVGLDRALHSGQSGQYVEKISPGASPSRLVGSVAFWLIFVLAISAAVGALQIQALTDFMAAIFSYLPNVIVAIIIFVLAGAVATAVGGLVARTMGDTPTGKLVGTIVPVLVMAIATFMILNQLKIAPQIVTITYACLMGAVALGMALAFGLGGREVASDILSSAYEKGQEKSDQVRQDLQRGKERAQQDAKRAQQAAQERMGGGGGGSSQQIEEGPAGR